MVRKHFLVAAALVVGLVQTACGLPEGIADLGQPEEVDSSSASGPRVSPGFTLGTAPEVVSFYASEDFLYLDNLADEVYTSDDYNTPGTLTFTVNDPGTDPLALESSWCADNPEMALDDWAYIETTFIINSDEVPAEYVYFDQWEDADGLGCVSDTVLVTGWPSGSHVLRVNIRQSQELGGVPAGDYIWVYNVSVP